MAQLRWPTIVPLGLLTLVTPGTNVNLAVNCGSLGGQVQDQGTPQVIAYPGTPLRQLVLTNTGSGTAFLMPKGKTALGNPTQILAAIPSGATIYLPNGQPFEGGFLPENYDLDCSAGCSVYGCGIING
jgi:hypothetical protein